MNTQLHEAVPLKNGRHPVYQHLVYCELMPHYGSYILTIQGQKGDALLSSEDAEHLLGDDILEKGYGYATDELVSLLVV